MIIKQGTTKDGKPKLVYHSHKKGEIKRFEKAFHSNCNHTPKIFLGCAGVIDEVNQRSIFFRGHNG